MPIRKNEIRYAVLAFAVWTIVVAVVAALFVRSNQQSVDELSLNQSRTLFQTIVDFRAWNASHGGVYVPVDERTPSNPYLDLRRRDVVTHDGQRLTLVNPAYMTRQFAEMSRHEDGLVVHITSRDPLRPGNQAAPWEAGALEELEAGLEEWWSYDAGEGDEPVFRYIAPLIADSSCLPCHAQQGYEVGDIRGGISITFPAAAFVTAKSDYLRAGVVTAAAVWVMGVALIVVVAETFRRRRLALTRAHEMTLVDSLTSVHNRRGFMTLAEASMRAVSRRGSRATIMFIDLDDFKSINDTFGHEEGDVALRRMADVLRATFRASDIIARLGGDEFLIMLPDTSRRSAELVRERLWEAIRHENERSHAPYTLSVSVGLVEYAPESPRSLDELIKDADREMYTEKRHRSANHRSVTPASVPSVVLRE